MRIGTPICATVGAFSFVINVLMLVPSLYMLQVYDRVLTSRNESTLLMLTLLTIGFFVCGFHVTFIGLHLPSYISDKTVGMSFFGAPVSALEVGGWAIGLVPSCINRRT